MNNTAPNGDELEVSLFGPGVGECVVVHLGDGAWMIIDSCLDESGQPVALSYLVAIGVDPTQAVKLIVVSHWHDDHIRGLAEIVHRCHNAKIVYSSALLKKEFLTFVDVMNDPSLSIDRGKSGLNEMARVIDKLHQRKTGRPPQVDLKPANADTRIFNTGGVEVWTLSPSSVDFNNALLEFSAMTEQLTTNYRGVVPAPTSNLNAVAIWVSSSTWISF